MIEQPKTHLAMVPLAHYLADQLYFNRHEPMVARDTLLTLVQSYSDWPITTKALGKALRALMPEPYPILHRTGPEGHRAYVWELPPAEILLPRIVALGPQYHFRATGEVVLAELPD